MPLTPPDPPAVPAHPSLDEDGNGIPDHGRSASVGAELSAFTIELPDEVISTLLKADPVKLGGSPGCRLWRTSDVLLLGSGEALRIGLPRPWARTTHTRVVTQVLSAIKAVPDDGSLDHSLIAMGALPYDPTAAGHLTVPRLLVSVPSPRLARPWATLVTADAGRDIAAQAKWRDSIEAEVVALAEAGDQPEAPDGFQLRSDISHSSWKELVRRAVADMGRGALDKVVLARRVDVVATGPFPLPETLSRLAALYPSCAVFNFNGFIGASPETLVRRQGDAVSSHPLAGTVARSGDEDTDAQLLAALTASEKDRREHQLVVDAIVDSLRPLCAVLDVPAQPATVALRNVSHLGTNITGKLRRERTSPTGSARGELPTALDLAGLLQPTPAVGGHPTAAALAWQRANEGFERGCYAGPVGWVDRAGDGEWALGLRSALVSGERATLYAGAGIVVGSDAEAELVETQLKLQALLAALVRP